MNKKDWASKFIDNVIYGEIKIVFYHDGFGLAFTKEVWENTPWYKSTWSFDYIRGTLIYG